MNSTTKARDYESVIARLNPVGSREERMTAVVDALWDELHDKGVSWVGFYLKGDQGEELVLGPRRDKPACSPISFYGACGRSFQSRQSLIVTDVTRLRTSYIACDPRDRSECVIPLLEGPYKAWGVLDLDSYDTYSFTRDDAVALQRLLEKMELTVENFLSIDTV